MPLPTITIVGTVVNDPELRYTTSGRAALKLRVACRDRILDRTINEWKDGDQLFINVEVWADQAEHVAAIAVRGTQVIVAGKVRTREYETKAGEKRSETEVKDAIVGISLVFQTVSGIERDRPAGTPAQAPQAPAAQAPAQAPAAQGNPFTNAF
jgi:single-strand DNA-binding protein